jgi:transcriptional regulator with XRE-family HTH domain
MASKTPHISKEMPNIGSILKENLDKSRYRPSELGRMLHISPISISRYTQQKSLQCYTLWNLSKVLNVNLFEPIVNALAITSPTNVNQTELLLQQRIIDLEKELAIYKEIVRGK